MNARTAFIRDEKVNTINRRLGKRNLKTAAVASSNNDQAHPYTAYPKSYGRILADEQTA